MILTVHGRRRLLDLFNFRSLGLTGVVSSTATTTSTTASSSTAATRHRRDDNLRNLLSC
jgi:hypothetical protein